MEKVKKREIPEKMKEKLAIIERAEKLRKAKSALGGVGRNGRSV